MCVAAFLSVAAILQRALNSSVQLQLIQSLLMQDVVMRTATVANTLSPQWKRDPFYFPVTVSAYVGMHSLRNPFCVMTVAHAVHTSFCICYLLSTYIICAVA
jgi:hypothetical protein